MSVPQTWNGGGRVAKSDLTHTNYRKHSSIAIVSNISNIRSWQGSHGGDYNYSNIERADQKSELPPTATDRIYSKDLEC